MNQPIIFRHFLLFLSALALSCVIPFNALTQFPTFEANVTNEIEFHDLPSASGIVQFQESYYVIGDDSPYLFQLDSSFQMIDETEIFSTKKLKSNRLPKKVKPDFECLTVVPWGDDEDILVFGSGDSKEREVLIKIDIDEGKARVDSYSLNKFYKHLSKESEGGKKLNIEGAGFWDNNLILLNREDNTLFMIDLEDFINFMKDKDAKKPKVKSHVMKLPSINGMSARFSGLSLLPDEDIIIFSASVENDPNWVLEEEIVCSYLGIIDLNQLDNDEPICELIMKDGFPIREKVESVHVKSKNESVVQLVGVIDNDDGSSKLIEFELTKTVD